MLAQVVTQGCWEGLGLETVYVLIKERLVHVYMWISVIALKYMYKEVWF